MPQKGDIAFCMHGFLGLITSDQTENEPSTAGNIGAEIWTGIQLTNRNNRVVGGPWQSRNPRVVAHSDTLADVFEKAAKYDDLCDAPPKVERRVLANPPEPGNLFPRHPATKGFASSICTDGSRANEGDATPAYVNQDYPRQPYEPVRYAADGLFDDGVDYNGD